MSQVLILGANGQVARIVTKMLLDQTNHQVTLYLRHSERLGNIHNDRVTVIEGDVNDTSKLAVAMQNQDIVYANLGGTLEPQAHNIVHTMDQAGVKRLIFITGLGIYDEVPGKFGNWNKSMLTGYLVDAKKAADTLESSDLDYTLLRCAWMTNEDIVDYEITEKGEPFKGTIISRKSIAALVLDLIQHPDHEVRASIGVNQPNTDGDKPKMY